MVTTAFAAKRDQPSCDKSSMLAADRAIEAPLTAAKRTSSPQRKAPARNVTPRFQAKLFTIPQA